MSIHYRYDCFFLSLNFRVWLSSYKVISSHIDDQSRRNGISDPFLFVDFDIYQYKEVEPPTVCHLSTINSLAISCSMSDSTLYRAIEDFDLSKKLLIQSVEFHRRFMKENHVFLSKAWIP